jgi:hypothetical protein
LRFHREQRVVGEAVHDSFHIVRVAGGDVARMTGGGFIYLRDRRAGWAGKMDDFEALEADFTAPVFKIDAE